MVEGLKTMDRWYTLCVHEVQKRIIRSCACLGVLGTGIIGRDSSRDLFAPTGSTWSCHRTVSTLLLSVSISNFVNTCSQYIGKIVIFSQFTLFWCSSQHRTFLVQVTNCRLDNRAVLLVGVDLWPQILWAACVHWAAISVQQHKNTFCSWNVGSLTTLPHLTLWFSWNRVKGELLWLRVCHVWKSMGKQAWAAVTACGNVCAFY